MGQTTDHFQKLVRLNRRLRGPGGCPWDRSQTFATLLPHLVEETWEVFCASKSRRRAHMRDELGDVLYTVIFLTIVAEEAGWFTLSDVLRQTHRKMVRRHPHVFKGRRAHTKEEAYASWQRAKQQERRRGAPHPPKFREQLWADWERLRRQHAANGSRRAASARSARSSSQ
ncbi:MAG: nucleoside triphosphate hydrolase [Candidatus Omnitrophica bacterium]|nr:nucleoside triphosphate hydrolase [Candidatus Omnitrophota bacterium]